MYVDTALVCTHLCFLTHTAATDRDAHREEYAAKRATETAADLVLDLKRRQERGPAVDLVTLVAKVAEETSIIWETMLPLLLEGRGVNILTAKLERVPTGRAPDFNETDVDGSSFGHHHVHGEAASGRSSDDETR